MTLKSKIKTTEDSDIKDNSGNLSDNGKIFKFLTESLQELGKHSDQLTALFGDAIARKIWLGFIHPATGEITSFIYRDNNGDVNDALSFKMWVSASPAKGGLGIDNFGMIENLLRGNQRVFDQVLPLLLDKASIKKANEIRSSQGEKPLQKIGGERQHYLRKISEAPNPVFSALYQKNLPFQIVGKSASEYSKLDESERDEIDAKLNKLVKNQDPKEVTLELQNIFEIPAHKTMRVDLSDPYVFARKIYDVCAEDVSVKFLFEVAKNLERLAKG